jgi:uncharacterized protein (DUF1501 family)
MGPMNPILTGRRDFLKLFGVAGMSLLTPLGTLLARAAEKTGNAEQPGSVILLWLQGGPSQLETFDPHPDPDSAIAGGTRSINTAQKGIKIAAGFEALADQLSSVSLIRSMISKEGDHERGTYLLKTGYRPDPTVVHPSIGAICCHELPAAGTDIPRHISILPNQWYGRGGFLGDEYDAFKCVDPAQKLPDLISPVPTTRDQQRVKDLDVVERAFEKGRKTRTEATLHRSTVQRARVMMTSEQLAAFEIKKEPAEVIKRYGDTPFGRSCLAARRLIEVGVRCVEVTLDGWDTHANKHSLTKGRVDILDPAFAALLRDLKERDLLKRTVVLCMGEFGRTPNINPLGGRDHWPNGFSIALTGGGLRSGRTIGATDPEGKKSPTDPVTVADVHATVLKTLGIDYAKVMTSPIGRTVTLTEGKPIPALVG